MNVDKLNHFVVHMKLTTFKSTILQLRKKSLPHSSATFQLGRPVPSPTSYKVMSLYSLYSFPLVSMRDWSQEPHGYQNLWMLKFLMKMV